MSFRSCGCEDADMDGNLDPRAQRAREWLIVRSAALLLRAQRSR
jgi:hypothetical protein